MPLRASFFSLERGVNFARAIAILKAHSKIEITLLGVHSIEIPAQICKIIYTRTPTAPLFVE